MPFLLFKPEESMSQSSADRVHLKIERIRRANPGSDEQLALFEEIPMDAMTEAQVDELYAAMGEAPASNKPPPLSHTRH